MQSDTSDEALDDRAVCVSDFVGTKLIHEVVSLTLNVCDVFVSHNEHANPQPQSNAAFAADGANQEYRYFKYTQSRVFDSFD